LKTYQILERKSRCYVAFEAILG